VIAVARVAVGGDRSARRANLLLAAGAAAGLALAAYEILRPAAIGGAVPPGAVALVNGQPVPRDDYERAVDGVAADRREPVSDAERRRVLDRLIEEELLLQRGLDLGLARRDARVRSSLVTAVIDVVAAEAAARQPSADEIARFYAENRDYFAAPGRARVHQLLVRVAKSDDDEKARARAAEAARRIRAGEDFAAVARELGDAPVAPLPDALLPPAKLREYLGPTASRVALDLPVGEVSDPVRSSAGYHVLRVLERDAGSAPPLADVEPEVRAELVRRNADRALRDYLAELRAHARVVVSEDAKP